MAILPDIITNQVLMAVSQERQRQYLLITKKGLLDCADPTISDLKKLPILGEEFGEVMRAIVELGFVVEDFPDKNVPRYEEARTQLYVELIQTAAVAVAWAESLKR